MCEKRPIRLLLCSLCVLMFFVLIPICPKAYVQSFDPTLRATTSYQIKLSWKKKSVSSYKIYRATYSNGKEGKYKKIAKISGKKTSYIDKKVKKGKTYCYKIKAYKGSKLKYASNSDTVYNGLGACGHDPDFDWTLGYSTDYIEVSADLQWGMVPTGYEIYRKIEGESYYRIEKVKSKEFFIKYEDRTVSPGQTYSYKIRAYKTIGKKTIYGKYSNAYTQDTFSAFGDFKVETLTEASAETKEFVVKLTNVQYSSPICMNYTSEGTGSYVYEYNPGGYGDDCYTGKTIVLKQFSYDNENWIDKEGRSLTIDSDSTIYLKFASYDGEAFNFDPVNQTFGQIEEFPVHYRGYPSYLFLDLKNGRGSTYWHSEDIA